ncbi:MAG: radical SAM protein [Candidatus Rokubacteria bacterium]|nr:radical SAM protein [Candidatus Rokubacteria bacterium]
MPKLMIIQATGYRFRDLRVPYKLRKRKLVGAVLPHLAALAPKEWEVTLVDDATQEVDYDADVDVVAITIRTVTSLRGYEIAARFRERKIPVVMGGPHATFYAAEIAEHADAVCIGEAEEVFPAMLEDAAAGRLKKTYRAERPALLDGLPAPRWDLLDPRKYVFYRPFVIQYSRGCPYTCDFCAERRLNGDYGYRYRPTEEVVEDIKRCGSRHIFFAASQFAGNKAHAMELMETLIPLKVRWSTLMSAHFCLDEKFMDVAKRSGLLHVNMGVESIDQKTLHAMNKDSNRVRQYGDVIRNLTRRDISYSLNFVLGSDEEEEDVFRTTLEFLFEHKVPTAYFNILVPLRGTSVHEQFKADGRLFDEENMERWPGLSCHFKPLRYSPEELVYRVAKIRRDFYTLGSAARRLPVPYKEAHFASWNLHFLQRKVANHLDSMRDFTEF